MFTVKMNSINTLEVVELGIKVIGIDNQKENIIVKDNLFYMPTRLLPLMKDIFEKWELLREKCPFLFENEELAAMSDMPLC